MKETYRSRITQWVVPISLIILGFTLRLLPHPANFVPIGAIALFSGLYLPRRFALLLPFAAMLLSDALIGFYNVGVMVSVYASFMLVGLIGLFVKKHKNIFSITGGVIGGSILFFLFTNTAVWAFSGMYVHTISGLFESYTMALPFFRNSLLGDLFYTGLFVGGFELAMYFVKRMHLMSLHGRHSLS